MRTPMDLLSAIQSKGKFEKTKPQGHQNYQSLGKKTNQI